jgi:hypothetical protein
VTEQVEVLAVADARAQDAELKVPADAPLLKLTVPAGADFVGESVSVTVAIQVEA